LTDVVMFAADFYEQFGDDRPLHSVGHDGLFMGPLADPMARLGVIRANQKTPSTPCGQAASC
jgi:hypothetical protein